MSELGVRVCHELGGGGGAEGDVVCGGAGAGEGGAGVVVGVAVGHRARGLEHLRVVGGPARRRRAVVAAAAVARAAVGVARAPARHHFLADAEEEDNDQVERKECHLPGAGGCSSIAAGGHDGHRKNVAMDRACLLALISRSYYWQVTTNHRSVILSVVFIYRERACHESD